MKKSTLGIIISLICSGLLIVIVLATKPQSPTTTDIGAQATQFSVETVAQHNSGTDCWMIIDGSVYDVTNYVRNHPGGDEILRGCGKDATSLFRTRRDGGERVGSGAPHSSSAKMTLESFKIGTIIN